MTPGEHPDVEADARRVIEAAGAEIIAGIERALPGWSSREVVRLVDAWGHHDPSETARVAAHAESAGRAAAVRIAGALAELLARDPDEQWATPLQIVRTAYREPTELLRREGVPPIERDEFARRSFPDDDYGLAPATLDDLGDDTLAPLLVTWGVAKATIHRARHAPPR